MARRYPKNPVLAAAAQGLAAQQTGQQAHNYAILELKRMGMVVLHTIVNDWRKSLTQKRKAGVRRPADIFGLTKNGRGVMVEVKKREKCSLGYNELEPHQHRHLREWAEMGGLSLVVFIDSAFNVAVFRYPVPTWVKGAPLKIDNPHRIRRRERLELLVP